MACPRLFPCSSDLLCSNLAPNNRTIFMIERVCLCMTPEANAYQPFMPTFGRDLKISPSWVLSGICKTSLCREDVNWYSLVGTYSPVIPSRKPFNWFPAAPFPWVSKLTECSTIPALKFFFSVFNGITGKKVSILCVYRSFLHYYEIICLFSIFFSHFTRCKNKFL